MECWCFSAKTKNWNRDCTVEENLLFSAQTRLPSQMSFAEQRAFVEDVMALIGLTELRDSVIGGRLSSLSWHSCDTFELLTCCASKTRMCEASAGASASA